MDNFAIRWQHEGPRMYFFFPHAVSRYRAAEWKPIPLAQSKAVALRGPTPLTFALTPKPFALELLRRRRTRFLLLPSAEANPPPSPACRVRRSPSLSSSARASCCFRRILARRWASVLFVIPSLPTHTPFSRIRVNPSFSSSTGSFSICLNFTNDSLFLFIKKFGVVQVKHHVQRYTCCRRAATRWERAGAEAEERSEGIWSNAIFLIIFISLA